jgi:hypothetical protein
LILLWINTYIARDLFSATTGHMGSMHGFWTAIAARAGGSWFHATWWPFWEMGIPFEFTYSPLVPALAAAIAALRGVSAGVGFHSVTGLCYILGPLTLFFAAWRLTRAPGASFVAGLLYSLTSITHWLLPDGDWAAKNFWDARRLFAMAVWDDTPHLAALVLLPLVVLFLARSIETRRVVYYAAAAACIGASALASAFGPVMVVLAAVCLLLVLRREIWFSNLLLVSAIGFWGWALAAPFLSPSFMAAIRQANAAQEDGWTVGSFTALALTGLGWAIIAHWLPRWTKDWRLQFFAVFAWVTFSIPLGRLAMHNQFLPQPNRYRFDADLALCLPIAFAAVRWWERIPTTVRRAAAILLLSLGAQQVAEYRKAEKKFTFPADVTGTVEYQVANWAQQHFPQIRYFMPGSVAKWTNTFTSVQQFTGESFSLAINRVQQRADSAIVAGAGDVEREVRITLAWLKAYGVGVIAISGKDSKEFWHGFTHPEKFEGRLPVVWQYGGVTLYRVPLREFALAHIVPESAIVRAVPRGPDDTREVERYAAALDDPALPGTSFDWEERNRIRIRTTVAAGQALSVQETYHPGWHASVDGKSQEIFKDGLGLMWLRPACSGSCEVVLDYDGGWELRLCRWLSWLAMAALFIMPFMKKKAAR